MNDNQEGERPVFILIGRVWVDKTEPDVAVHILLSAPDDDTAIREALNALAEDGYEEAEFDQIGTLTGAPDEEPHASAYQGALEGEVAIVSFADLGDDDQPEAEEEVNPFDVLRDWKPGD